MNFEREDMSTLYEKWMLIIKGRFHRFQLSNRHNKGIEILLRTLYFHFKVLKGVLSFWY